jgi:hypothetical protein
MPAISCDPAALAKSSACFCYTEPEARKVIIYLLRQIAGSTLTPAQLAQAAAGYAFDQRTADSVIAYLLCQIGG